jgi:hypothetical protein
MTKQILKAIADMVAEFADESVLHAVESTQLTIEDMVDHFELKLREGLK